MLKVAKVLFKNHEDKYLVLFRNNHPLFGNSMDLPGGTVEKGETLEDGAMREVREESGIELTSDMLNLLERTRKHSRIGTLYALYAVQLQETPDVVLSWEHSRYAWVSKDDFIQGTRQVNDKFLQMAVDSIEKH